MEGRWAAPSQRQRAAASCRREVGRLWVLGSTEIPSQGSETWPVKGCACVEMQKFSRKKGCSVPHLLAQGHSPILSNSCLCFLPMHWCGLKVVSLPLRLLRDIYLSSLEDYLLKLTLPNPSNTTNSKKALIHTQPPSSCTHWFCPDSKISMIRVFLRHHLKRLAHFHQCIFCSAWITDFYPENAPDLLQFSALISVTYTKEVLCANSCVKANQVGANLAKKESVQEKLFRSDRESIVIF